LTCVKILVQLSHKIIGLDLAPFSEKVENHWLILCRSRRHAMITRLESRKLPDPAVRVSYNLAALEIVTYTCVRDYQNLLLAEYLYFGV